MNNLKQHRAIKNSIGKSNGKSHGKSKTKSYYKEKNKRENRCCSSIAAHNLNKSLFGKDIDLMLVDKRRSNKKITVRSRSKSKKSPKRKKFESSGEHSFHQKRLNLSQMFNYYSNYPVREHIKVNSAYT